jgi:probable F420-dependent oxidoreductase
MSEKRNVKFGLRLPTFALKEDTAHLDEMAAYLQAAEDLGFETAFVIDHLIITPPAYSTTWLDALTVLTALAARTEKIKLGPLVLVLPLWNPVRLAKVVATMDFLSGGRVILGVGVGWNPKEFEIFDTPLRRRGVRTTEAIQLMKRVWTEDDITHHGEFYTLNGVTIEPKPVQKPHPPIWIGGGTQPSEIVYGTAKPNVDPVLRRIACHADAWVPHSSSTPEMNRQDWERLKHFAEEEKRDLSTIEIVYSNFAYVVKGKSTRDKAPRAFARYSGLDFSDIEQYYLIGPPEQLVDRIAARLQATDGMDHIVLNPLSFDMHQLQLIAEEIMPHFK